MTTRGSESAPFVETLDLVSEQTLRTIEQGGDAAQRLNMNFCASLFIAVERGAQQALRELRQVDPASMVVLDKAEDVSANGGSIQLLVMPDIAMSRSFDSHPLMDCHVAFTTTIGPFLRAVRTMHKLVERRRLYVVPATFEWSCDGDSASGMEPYSFTIVFCQETKLMLQSDCE